MSFHHTSDPACPLCDFKLTQADPYLSWWYKTVVKPNFQRAHISWSYRDQENQEQCFRDGKSKLHYPHSRHNKMDENGNPKAEALDLFEIDENGIGVWHPGFFVQINSINESRAIAVEWGPKIGMPWDGDHFQLA